MAGEGDRKDDEGSLKKLVSSCLEKHKAPLRKQLNIPAVKAKRVCKVKSRGFYKILVGDVKVNSS